ncbi:hypothetical protein BDW71DRAFT_191100 [Aspergillus fruticulosus]
MVTMNRIQAAVNAVKLQVHHTDMPGTFWDRLSEDEKMSSVDQTCSRKFQDAFAWEARGRAKQKWADDIYPKLKVLLNEKHKDLNPKSRKLAIYTITCWMVGKEWHLSHPAAIFVCSNKKVAKRALRHMKRFLKDEDSGFHAYSHITEVKLNHGGGPSPDQSSRIGLCGSLVNVGSADEPFERQTTVGGVISIDGHNYCMTAGHPFFSMDEGLDDSDDHDSDGSDSSDDNDHNDNENLSFDIGMTDGSTVELENLTADYIYKDQHTCLGRIPDETFLSKRFDWALLKTTDNIVPGPNKIITPSGGLIPWKISSSSPECPLWAATGTHKSVEIRSCPTLSGICLDNLGILDVWSLDMMSYPGDSGSWVVDPCDFSIVAIIVARCDDLGVTYALPASDVFRDIIRNIGSKPEFLLGDEETLLSLATGQGKTELVSELLSSSAVSFNSSFGDVLRVASEEGHEKIAQLLLDKGVDINASGGAALRSAAAQGHEKIVQLLLDWGADINASGGNVLWRGAAQGHEKNAQLPLKKGSMMRT